MFKFILTQCLRTASLYREILWHRFTPDFGWIHAYPIARKADAHLTLDLLHCDFGVFHTITVDNAKELTQKDFLQKVRKAGSIVHPTEPYTPNQNRAESAIRELKRMYRMAMTKSNAPRVLWGHCLELQAEIRSHTALDILQLQGDTPQTKLTGDTANISHLCQFEWYQYVWYIHPVDTMDSKHLGRYLGPSHRVGDVMCSKILTAKATVLVRSSVYPITANDLAAAGVKAKLEQFEVSLKEKLQDHHAGLPKEAYDVPDYIPDEVPSNMIPEADEMNHEAYDKYISARVWLPNPEGVAMAAKVTGIKMVN
jgi:hypothetical protein